MLCLTPLLMKLVLDRKTVSVEALFEELKVCIAPCLSARSITLSIVPCQGTVYVDVLRLLLAMHNIAVNAVEAMSSRRGDAYDRGVVAAV